MLRATRGDRVDLTELGHLVDGRLHAIPEHHHGVRLDDSIVMPDHIHAILFLPGGGETLGTVVGAFKASVVRLSNRRGLWQRGFHDHVIRDEDDLDRVRAYIRGNPYRVMRGRHGPDRSGPYGRMHPDGGALDDDRVS